MGASLGTPKPQTPVETINITQNHPNTEKFTKLDTELKVLQTDLSNAMKNKHLSNQQKIEIHQKITNMTLQLNKDFALLYVDQCAKNSKRGGKKSSAKKNTPTKKQLSK